jgi:short subunit dehydrogenase-like uncharacterized protein
MWRLVAPTDERRDFDLVLFGATGFTGQLVARYLATTCTSSGAPHSIRIAVAGRNRAKLEAVASGLEMMVAVVIADALDANACLDLAARTRVLCSTAGPYATYGSELVAACAAAGTHYCDLTGEVHWMRKMIDAHHHTAQRTGARIVHACGFDSIPSDLGTWATQQEFIARYGKPARSVTAFFCESSGGLSGGTVASAFGIAEAKSNAAVRRIVSNPYGLDPDPKARRPTVLDDRIIGWDKGLGVFTAPFVMASTNSRVVRRGHALAGFPWGQEFVYREVMSTPGNARGLAMAMGFQTALAAVSFVMRRPKLRAILRQYSPKPGEGPSDAKLARGHWKVRFVAENPDDSAQRLVYTVADPHGDPGYASTSKMLAESALCLAFDPLPSSGGVLTPSVAMGAALLARLRAAGLQFSA